MMKTARSLVFCIISCLLLPVEGIRGEESRTWTSSKTGRQFKGILVGVEGESLSIRRDTDKAVFEVKKSDLVPEDWDWIQRNNSSPEPAAGPVEDLSVLIAAIPADMGTPAVGVLLVTDGNITGMGVAGVRKFGEETGVQISDKWHLGSCTKSMTATLAAVLVEEGKISWESTVGGVLGKELEMREEYRPITLGLLLANRGGISGDVPQSVVYAGIDTGAAVGDLKDRELLEQRSRYVEAVLKLEPSSPPNTQYEYSNAGFVVAGAMLEQVTGKPWERLIEEKIFGPLGMEESGFGNAARSDRRDPTQPWPHRNGPTAVEPGAGDDNPWVIGPAGTVHGSLKDVARYLAMHASREAGPVIRNPETYQYLHTALPDNQNYARGWILGRAGWTEGPAISHNGSNTMNHCSFWIAPERKAAVAAFTNSDEKGSEVCSRAIQSVVEKYLE